MKWFVLEFHPYEGYSFDEFNSEAEAIEEFNRLKDLDKEEPPTDLILIKGEIITREANV